VHAVTSAAAPEFEGMHRAGAPFAPAARFHAATVDTRRSKKNFLATSGADFASAERDRVRAVLSTALTEAGVAPPDLRCVVLPRLAGRVLADTYLPLLAEITPAKPLDLGRRTGHLGAGDLLAGVAALMDPDLLGPGEFGAVLSAGAGFTWSVVIIEGMS